MNYGKYTFAQVFEFVSHNDFLKCVNKSIEIKCDQTIKLCGFYASQDYPENNEKN
jgi:hypothetical protein